MIYVCLKRAYLSGVALIFLITGNLSFVAPAQALEAVTSAEDGSRVVLFTGRRCKDMAIGSRRQVQYSSAVSDSGIESMYTLTRDSDKQYTADLKVKFINRGYDGPDRPGRGSADEYTKVDTIFRKKMRDCFSEYKGKLKDARGNILNLNLSETAEDTSRFTKGAETIEIDIVRSGERSHSRAYQSKIDCPTMIHEALHLMGLCDEYKETARKLLTDQEAKNRGFKGSEANAYDCRRLGPETSIMNNQDKALEPFQPKPAEKSVTFFFCACGGVKDCAWGEMKKGMGCPEGTVVKATGTEPSTPEFIKKLEQSVVGSSNMVVYSESEVAPATTGAPRDVAVLSNEQMNVILYPRCDEKNGTYYTCAQDAYNTSRERGGDGCNAPNSCREKNPK